MRFTVIIKTKEKTQPADYFPLIAEGRDAFIKKGDCIVGHGGVSIEEVMVPLVKIEQRVR